MRITKCDICESEMRGNLLPAEIVLSFGDQEYKDICSHCAGKVERLVEEIKNRPATVCPKCGKVSR